MTEQKKRAPRKPKIPEQLVSDVAEYLEVPEGAAEDMIVEALETPRAEAMRIIGNIASLRQRESANHHGAR